jgi:hypothetical protein
MEPEHRPKFVAVRDFLTEYRFPSKIAVLAARVHLRIDSEQQAWDCLALDQQCQFIEALKFLRTSDP